MINNHAKKFKFSRVKRFSMHVMAHGILFFTAFKPKKLQKNGNMLFSQHTNPKGTQNKSVAQSEN
jgi:hypothetical protein